MKALVWLVLLVISTVILAVFIALANATLAHADTADTVNKIIQSWRVKKTKTYCYVEGYRYIRSGNKVIKVPVTVCEEK